MGVRDNHTKYEPETQRRRPGSGVASGGPPFQNLLKMANKCPFLASLGAYDVHGGVHLHRKQPR